MNNPDKLCEILSDLSNWKTLANLADENPQFSYSQLKTLFWKRTEHEGLSTCVRIIGNRLYINAPAFGLWLANPELVTSHIYPPKKTKKEAVS